MNGRALFLDRVACAASDNTNGRVVIWHLNPAAGSQAFEHRGDFTRLLVQLCAGHEAEPSLRLSRRM